MEFFDEKGRYHRLDGPAVEDVDGDKHWYKNGLRHRNDGPAVEDFNGDKYWYKEGEFHREDGPAVEYTDGTKAWYYNNKELNCKSQEEFEKILKLKIFW